MSTRVHREDLQAVALRLFSERGFESVSVAEVAKAAGVSHMTFFRNFPTKESVAVTDLFDPALAKAVADQDPSSSPLERVVRGFVAAMGSPHAREELSSESFRMRIRLVADTPALRGAVWTASADTETALFNALIGSGSPRNAARAAAGAAMGAATAVLLEWASNEGDVDAAEALTTGLVSLISDWT